MKKQVVKKQILTQGVTSKVTQSHLLHLLSPLEITARNKAYKPFTYCIGNNKHILSQDFCYYLQAITETKITLFLKLKAIKATKQVLNPNVKNFSTFINSPLTKFRLTKRLIHQLNENEIYTMSQVLYYGVHNLSTFPYITFTELELLMQIFEKNNCLALFLRND